MQNYSTTYVAVIVNVLSFVLPLLGVTIVTENLTTAIQTFLTIFTGVWILFKRWQAGKNGVIDAVSFTGVKQ